ncbi:Uncharacterised protein [Salmonella enterica subsp. enterica]|uniref:Uncharacterized protein n=1 Tax=Salmonella enterica I TaxID=59201 RepID=A0A3S4J9R1_SALET|nr:Uncharacterised protein [Salmonella enterica subsp. enterica]
MNLWIGRRGVVTDLRDIHRIEQVMIAAVIAVHIDFAFFPPECCPLLHPAMFSARPAQRSREQVHLNSTFCGS